MVVLTVKREAAAHLRVALGLSERWACQIVAIDRTTVSYAPTQSSDTELRESLRDLANASRPFGYRRLFILLCPEGGTLGQKPYLQILSRR
jgi:hypothetical protein